MVLTIVVYAHARDIAISCLVSPASSLLRSILPSSILRILWAWQHDLVAACLDAILLPHQQTRSHLSRIFWSLIAVLQVSEQYT